MSFKTLNVFDLQSEFFNSEDDYRSKTFSFSKDTKETFSYFFNNFYRRIMKIITDMLLYVCLRMVSFRLSLV